MSIQCSCLNCWCRCLPTSFSQGFVSTSLLVKYFLTCLFKYNLYNRQTSERNYLTDLPRSGGYIYGFQCKLASRRHHNKFLSQNRMLRYRQINVRLLLPASKCLKMHILVLCCDGNPKNQFQELKPLAKHLSSWSWMKPEDGFILWLLWICKSAVNGPLLAVVHRWWSLYNCVLFC